MILLQIYMFLRHDEIHGLEVQQIIPQYSAIEPHKIINLCFQIQGKTDGVPQNLILWAKDDCTDLCPVRHFLSYIHLCKIDGNVRSL
jgi:hypothetical protein